MKIEEIWKEKLANEGIDFNYEARGGKYPYVAEINLPTGNKISIRGKKVKGVLYLISNDHHDLKKLSIDEAYHFTHLLEFFQEFAKTKDAKSMFFYDTPFGKALSYNLVNDILPEKDYFHIDKKVSETLKKSGMIDGSIEGWIKKSDDCPICVVFNANETCHSFFKEKAKNETTFSLKYPSFSGFDTKIHFHYSGLDGVFRYAFENDEIRISEDKTNISFTITPENLPFGLVEFFNRLKKQVKVKSIFTNSSHYLQAYLDFVGVPYGLKNKIKEALKATHVNHILEEKCAELLKKKKKTIFDHYSYCFFTIADDCFVTNRHDILIQKKKSENQKVFEYYEKCIIDEMEREIKDMKNELQKQKKSILS